MTSDKILQEPITGAEVCNGLPIDEAIWTEAHDEHRLHRQLHARAAHGVGILVGFEVTVSPQDPCTLLIAPGAAIDPEGQTIMMSARHEEPISSPHEALVVLRWNESRYSKPAVGLKTGPYAWRRYESFSIYHTNEPPAEPYIELARVRRTSATAAIRPPRNPYAPGDDELDLLFRRHAFPRCIASGAIAEVSYQGTPGTDTQVNRAGLAALIREGAERGFHLHFGEPFDLAGADESENPLLLYMGGAGGWSQEPVGATEDYLGRGGFLILEAANGSASFERDLETLAKKLGANLKPVTANHPLMRSHYAFPEIPEGGVPNGKLLIDDQLGVLVSTMDFGGAWSGRFKGRGTRDAVRTAVEFGLNIIAYAEGRRGGS